jgi:hypothetical protein
VVEWSLNGGCNTNAQFTSQEIMMIKFQAGAHADVKFTEEFVMPLFEKGLITEFPGADYYAICYGELCAYKGEDLVAVWSEGFPDCEEDVTEDDLDPANWTDGAWFEQ